LYFKEELGGVDDLPEGENDEEDSDQEYTTKKTKPIKKPDPVVDPVFQSRLVRKIVFQKFLMNVLFVIE
jgi:hypothetical protein